MDRLVEEVQKRRTLFFLLEYGYIIFSGCFCFPLFKILLYNYYFLYMIVISYALIAMIFCGLFYKKPFKVFLSTFNFSGIGMGCRYLLEYGEVSNTENFTVMNMAVFLVGVPLFVTIVYLILQKITATHKPRA